MDYKDLFYKALPSLLSEQSKSDLDYAEKAIEGGEKVFDTSYLLSKLPIDERCFKLFKMARDVKDTYSPLFYARNIRLETLNGTWDSCRLYFDLENESIHVRKGNRELVEIKVNDEFSIEFGREILVTFLGDVS